jgi:excisionase family DNA binding protein
MTNDKLYTPEEAVAYLGLDRQGLRQPLEALRWLCRTGRLKYTKVGRRLRFRETWLDELIERNAIQRGGEAPPS